MIAKKAVTAVFSMVSWVAFSQNTTLIDPRTRFNNLNLTVPVQDWPGLQTGFEVPPDCGETSYRGNGRLQGRRALITGGDSGIGRSIVIAYAREGAHVAINYLPEEEPDAQDLADFLSKEGLNITRIPGDLLNETFCENLVERANEALGGLDILVNNAGYSGPLTGPNYRAINNITAEQIDRVFRTNVYASFFTTRAAVRLLPPGASLIFTTSNVARLPPPNTIDYAASKAAIVAMVRGLSVQLAPLGIRVNAVAPGLTFTPLVTSSGYDTQTLLSSVTQFPNGRLEQPAELAPMYVNLATADETYTSGTIVGVTGAQQGF